MFGQQFYEDCVQSVKNVTKNIKYNIVLKFTNVSHYTKKYPVGGGGKISYLTNSDFNSLNF